MKAFKREMIRILIEYTGRPELFKRIRFTDENPFLASFRELKFTNAEIEEMMEEDPIYSSDEVGGKYGIIEDIIYIKTPTETYENICLTPEIYTRTLNVILHEVCHRIQYTTKVKFDKLPLPHGKEFQEACLELGLDPQFEAYDETEFIDYNINADVVADQTYHWMKVAGEKHWITAMNKYKT